MLTKLEADQLRQEILKEISNAYNRGFDCCRGLVNDVVRSETCDHRLSRIIGEFIKDKIDSELDIVHDVTPEDIEEDFFDVDDYIDSITVCDDIEKATA